MKLTITNRLKIDFDCEPIQKDICDKLTLLNPIWEENNRQSRWNRNTHQYLCFYEHSADGNLINPRGFTWQAIAIAREHSEPLTIDDQRRTLPEVDFTFGAELKPYQREAVGQVLRKDFGVLDAPTGSGKGQRPGYLIMSIRSVYCRRRRSLDQECINNEKINEERVI